MPNKFLIPAAAALILGAGVALAQDAPPKGDMPAGHHWRMDGKEMQAHLKMMCTGRYAHAVGGMADLAVRLNLTETQKPAFERWKDAVLASAKSGEEACLNHKMPDKRPGAVEMLTMEEHMLEMHADGIKAQMPALEQLTAALSPEQDKTLDRAIMHVLHARHGMHGMMGHHGMGGHDMHGHGMDGHDMGGMDQGR